MSPVPGIRSATAARPGWRAALAVCLACGGAGCGGNGLSEVHGVVTLDGNPVANAAVYFHPQFEGGKVATAATDDKGRFELNTYGVGKGAAPGEYKVTVFKSPDADQRAKGAKDPPLPGQGGARRRSALPPQYDDPAATPLRVTVPHSGDVPLELFTRK